MSKLYTLEKLSDDVFNGKHPNNIFEGDLRRGHFTELPTKGKRFHFGNDLDRSHNHLFTSTVREVLGDGVFKTTNSTYKLTLIKNN